MLTAINMITIVPTRVRCIRCSNLLNTQPVKNKSGEETIITQATCEAENFSRKCENDAVKKKAIPVPIKNWSQKSCDTTFHSEGRTFSSLSKKGLLFIVPTYSFPLIY